MTDQLIRHGGWVISVYYSSPTHWAYQGTKETLTHTAKGTVKAVTAREAQAAVIGLINSHNLNESEIKVKP